MKNDNLNNEDYNDYNEPLHRNEHNENRFQNDGYNDQPIANRDNDENEEQKRQEQQQEYQNGYQRGMEMSQERKHKHHFHKFIIWVLVLICVIGGVLWFKDDMQQHQLNNQSQQTQQIQNQNQNLQQQARDDESKLQSKLQKVQLQQQEQQKIMDMYEKLNAQRQVQIYNLIAHHSHLIPSNAGKRVVIKKVINHYYDK